MLGGHTLEPVLAQGPVCAQRVPLELEQGPELFGSLELEPWMVLALGRELAQSPPAEPALARDYLGSLALALALGLAASEQLASELGLELELEPGVGGSVRPVWVLEQEHPHTL